MYRFAQRAAFGIGAWFLLLLVVPHPAATADELPQNACGIRAPFSLFQDMIEQSLQETLDAASVEAGVSMSITGIQIVPRLGQLGYQTVDNNVRPFRLDAGSPNDTSTSDDDYIDIILTVQAGGVTTFDLHVAIAFPQSRPDMVDPVEGTTCMCRTYVDNTRYLIQTVPPCDPEEEPTYQTANCRQPYWDDGTDVTWGQTFDFVAYSADVWEGAGLNQYNQEWAYPELVQGITDNNGDPVACEDVHSVMCSTLTPTERQANGITDGDVLDTHACILCIDEHWNEDPVWIDPDAFPNLLAVQVWYSGAGPVARAYLDIALKEQGFMDPHTEISGWPFERACCLQRELGQTNNANENEPIDQIAGITGTRDFPGFGSVDMGQLIRDSGGVRISEIKEALFLMIPPVNVRPNDNFIRPDGERACSRAHEYLPLTTLIPENLASQITSYQLLDAPKVLDFYLKNLASTRDFAAQGMQVTCNHAEPCPQGVPDYDDDGLCQCWELGITDVDGDGICDDVDYCRHTVSGANCDSDGDGYGDAPRGMVYKCLKPPVLTPLVDYGQTLEAARQFYCGGCDNCPKAYNPRTHAGSYDVINPNPGRWAWWAAVLIDENGDPVVPIPTIPLPSRQEDRDGDSIGDACDEDADGDGVHVEHDCDDMNAQATVDLDGDGLCDSVNTALCRGECDISNARYASFDLGRCREICDRPDNCADSQSDVCVGAAGCSSTEAAESADRCDPGGAGNCRFIGGLDWPDSSFGNRCLPAETWCADVYSNQDQSDVDGDDLGDKCDWLNVGKPTFEAPQEYSLDIFWNGERFILDERISTGDQAQIDFRAWGGQPTVVGNQIQHNPETRTHTQIGACWCDDHAPDGTWDPFACLFPDRCPGGQDARHGESYTAWTPINSPQCSTMPYNGDPAYEQDYNTYGICFARELDFSRDEATNHQGLSWWWNQARSFPDPTMVIGGEYDEGMGVDGPRSTAIRVAWPNGETINFSDLYNREVAISNNKKLGVFSLQSIHALFQGGDPAPLPPHFAVASVGPFDPIAPVARSAYLITEDQLGVRPSLLAISRGTPEVTRSFEARFSDPIDFTGEIAGAAGAVDRGLVGGTAGIAAGVFVYQSPASPAKLFIGY